MRIALLLLGLTIACATTPAARDAGNASDSQTLIETRTRVRGSDMSTLAAFVPAVAAVSEGGECDTLALGGDVYLVSLLFPSRADDQRRVSLRIDGRGTLLSYSDLRGDRRRPEERTGPLTAVTINFGQGGTAANEWPGRPAELTLGTADDFLTSELLGKPGDMVKLIQARCLRPGQRAAS